MKKILLILLLLITPTLVNAETKYLYDVLKNEAENNGLAKEYTGDHHDSFTEEPSKKIYHWYAENDEEGNQILEKNNVIFANFCWQMIRTTDTGGVKLTYNGIPNEGKCNNIAENTEIGKLAFISENNGISIIGYMYNPDIILSGFYDYNSTKRRKYGQDVSYSDGKYTILSPSDTLDENHHYTCNSTATKCTKVYYSSTPMFFYTLENGLKIEDYLNESLWSDNVNKSNSNIKDLIETWYQNNMVDYTNYLEDTIFCNDRKQTNICWFDPNGGIIGHGDLFKFNNYGINLKPHNEISLKCENETDKFSIHNSLAKLDYPVSLLSAPEIRIINNNNAVKTGSDYYTISPSMITHSGDPGIIYIDSTGIFKIHYNYTGTNIGVRPSISIKRDTSFGSGNGSKDNPYIVDLNSYYKVIIEEPVKKGDIEFEIEDLSSLPEGTEVKFKITPVKGYKLEDLEIVDEEENNIEYTTPDKINFKFTMPATDVTIKPQYKEIESNIINPNTKRQVLLIVISIIILGIMTFIFIKKKHKN